MSDPQSASAAADLDGSVRRDRMLDRLHTEGRLDVNRLAEEFAVARETIRRDLRTLEDQGALQRVHGGAVASQPVSRGPRESTEQDLRLGLMLWHRVPRAGTVLIGAGRPGQLLAEAMIADPPEQPGLTVITCSIDAAVLLSRIPELNVYNVGGTVAGGSHAQEGAWPIEELRRLRADLCLISPDGVDPRGGLTCQSPAAAAVAQAQVAASERMIVLAERHTLGRVALVRFADARDVCELVVPPGLDSPVLADLAGLGISLI